MCLALRRVRSLRFRLMRSTLIFLGRVTFIGLASLTKGLIASLTGGLEEEEGTKFVEGGADTEILSTKPKPVLNT